MSAWPRRNGPSCLFGFSCHSFKPVPVHIARDQMCPDSCRKLTLRTSPLLSLWHGMLASRSKPSAILMTTPCISVLNGKTMHYLNAVVVSIFIWDIEIERGREREGLISSNEPECTHRSWRPKLGRRARTVTALAVQLRGYQTTQSTDSLFCSLFLDSGIYWANYTAYSDTYICEKFNAFLKNK